MGYLLYMNKLIQMCILIILVSCSISKKNIAIRYEVNDCLYYRGFNLMIIDKDEDHFYLFYPFDDVSYVAKERYQYVKEQMIPVECKKDTFKKMEKFIQKKYQK